MLTIRDDHQDVTCLDLESSSTFVTSRVFGWAESFVWPSTRHGERAVYCLSIYASFLFEGTVGTLLL